MSDPVSLHVARSLAAVYGSGRRCPRRRCDRCVRRRRGGEVVHAAGREGRPRHEHADESVQGARCQCARSGRGRPGRIRRVHVPGRDHAPPHLQENQQREDQLLGVWPPVTVTSTKGLRAQSGIKGKLGTFRNHGMRQLTLGGQPLYYFTPDIKSGNKKLATGDELKTSARSGTSSTANRSVRRRA